MSNILSNFITNQTNKLNELRGFALPQFNVGDTVNVKYKITEDNAVRIQAFSGVVIAKTKGQGNYSSTFTVRKISDSIGVERKFLCYSPLLAGVDVVKKGDVRKAKLYYLRKLTGKSSRIKEKKEKVEEAK